MKYKFVLVISIIGLVLAILMYPFAPIITYLFGAYMLLFIGFLYLTDIRGNFQLSTKKTTVVSELDNYQ